MASQSTTTGSLPIAAFFSSLVHSIPRLVLTNLIFAVPLGGIFALLRTLTVLTGMDYQPAVFVQLLTVFLAFPFYAGVVKVTSKLVMGEEKVPVFRSFLRAVKENFLRFLVHGAVFYLAVVFSWFSIIIYANLLSRSFLFLGTLIVSVLVMLFFLFMFFYLPVMTVTFELPMKYIYKNSFLMSYGELKKNFIALFGLLVLMVISTTFLIACYGSVAAVIIVTISLIALVVPAFASFIIHSAICERMFEMLTAKEDRVQVIDAKIEETKKKREKQVQLDNFKQRLVDFEIDEKLPDDEYIFFEGRMMKKSALVKMKQEAMESEES